MDGKQSSTQEAASPEEGRFPARLGERAGKGGPTTGRPKGKGSRILSSPGGNNPPQMRRLPERRRHVLLPGLGKPVLRMDPPHGVEALKAKGFESYPGPQMEGTIPPQRALPEKALSPLARLGEGGAFEDGPPQRPKAKGSRFSSRAHGKGEQSSSGGASQEEGRFPGQGPGEAGPEETHHRGAKGKGSRSIQAQWKGTILLEASSNGGRKVSCQAGEAPGAGRMDPPQRLKGPKAPESQSRPMGKEQSSSGRCHSRREGRFPGQGLGKPGLKDGPPQRLKGQRIQILSSPWKGTILPQEGASRKESRFPARLGKVLRMDHTDA
ncbi:S-antigen protein-like [Macrobrachium nipponense]|uniref:S-antigen protein-like n=1 Tax=Macrobrachium nipponense TaxID=159736 RepID=UPI0030C8A936